MEAKNQLWWKIVFIRAWTRVDSRLSRRDDYWHSCSPVSPLLLSCSEAAANTSILPVEMLHTQKITFIGICSLYCYCKAWDPLGGLLCSLSFMQCKFFLNKMLHAISRTTPRWGFTCTDRRTESSTGPGQEQSSLGWRAWWLDDESQTGCSVCIHFSWLYHCRQTKLRRPGSVASQPVWLPASHSSWPAPPAGANFAF